MAAPSRIKVDLPIGYVKHENPAICVRTGLATAIALHLDGKPESDQWIEGDVEQSRGATVVLHVSEYLEG